MTACTLGTMCCLLVLFIVSFTVGFMIFAIIVLVPWVAQYLKNHHNNFILNSRHLFINTSLPILS